MSTIFPIILLNVDATLTIHGDGWKAYSNLREHFAVHETVTRSENFVDNDTAAKTQLIECV